MEAQLTNPSGTQILAINGGSSSLKAALFDCPASPQPPQKIASASADRIASPDARITVTSQGKSNQQTTPIPDHNAALKQILASLQNILQPSRLLGIGHRVVHGGPKYSSPQLVTPTLIQDLKTLQPFDPEHLPAEIQLIETLTTLFPKVPQVVCFDTAFHHNLPPVARRIPIPRKYDAVGIRRYGFHGISFAYLMEQLHLIDPHESQGRIILAHLGNGSSLAAVNNGICIDTTMSLTPAAGVPMGTRSGDIDPGLPAYLARTTGMTLDAFNQMIHLQSGLLGISETTGDMQRLQQLQSTDPRAQEAIDLYCYQIKKTIGALAAALGGLDTLLFSGGIGEHSPQTRQQICQNLQFLGISLNPDANQSNAPFISDNTLPAKVRVIPTNEEQMLANQVTKILASP